MDQPIDHPPGDKPGGDGRHAPRDHHDDKGAQQGLEVMDVGHPILLGRRRRTAGSASKNPVEEGHRGTRRQFLVEEAGSVVLAAPSPVVAVVEAAGVGLAGGAAGVEGAAVMLSVHSEGALRDSRIALPAAEPSSGSRPGPKMISTTTRMATIPSGAIGIL